MDGTDIGRQDSRLTSIRGTEHALMNCPACETPGCKFIAGSGVEPRLDNFEVSVRMNLYGDAIRLIHHRLNQQFNINFKNVVLSYVSL